MQPGSWRRSVYQLFAGMQPARMVPGLFLASLALLPVFSFLGSATTFAARAAVVAMAAAGVARPDLALLVAAGLSPLGGALGAICGSPRSLTEPLVLAFLGGWLLSEAVRPAPRADRTTRAVLTPALLLAGAVAASCAVQLVVLQAFADYPGAFVRQILVFLSGDYFLDRGAIQAIADGALPLEGLGLFLAAVTLARRDPNLGGEVARMVAAGAAGVAALNVNRLLTVSLRTGKFWEALTAYIPTLRISSVFPDLNAAGSFLAMTVLLSGGLIFAGRRLHAGWFAITCLMLAALWLTGSRSALVAAPLAGVLVLAVVASLKGRWPLRPVLIGAAVLVLMALAIAQSSENAGRSLSRAVSIRLELARTGLRMFGTHPVFGVGVGRYYPLSTEFSSAHLRSVYPRENAHNNFLQILAELGIVGLALFLWILVAVGRHVWPTLVASRASPVLMGAVGGLSAFLLTCLAGHPLLIPEVAYTFWLVLGLTVGLAVEIPAGGDQQRVRKWWASRRLLVGAATLLLIVSVPIRGRQMLAEADLEHAAIGFSAWQTDSEGVRFRWMVEHAQFYVPTTANAVGLPLRLEAAGGSERSVVELYLEGRLATRIRLERGAWQDVRFVMPQAKPGERFWRIELRVPATPDGTGSTGDVAAQPRIQVGRLELTLSKR